MAFLDPILDPIFNPLLNISSLFGIILIAFVITAIITLAYWKFTDQAKMKELKKEQKDFQKRMKELREHPEQLMHLQKEAMKKNFEYMKHSLKPTLITMLPILLIFGWMTANLAYEPIYPGESFELEASFVEEVIGLEQSQLVLPIGVELIGESAVQGIGEDGTVSWRVRAAEEGMYTFYVMLGEIAQSKDVLITTELDYEEATSKFKHSDIEEITIKYDKLTPFGDFSLFGWMPGWLAIYIVFSLVFSLSLRKIFDLH